MIQQGDTFELGTDAVAQQVGGELIILDMATERYLAVDPVGSQIWNQLTQNRSLFAVVDAIAARYTVDRARIESDVAAFVGQLEALGLGRRS